MNAVPSNVQFTKLRGFRDLIGPDARLMEVIEERARMIAHQHNVTEVRVPVLERLDLYARSTGETSDIVEKQLYVVQRSPESHGVDDQVVRPEGTPGVVRAYIEAGLDRKDPEQRYFYCGPMFRYERPQKGRYREFYQFGVEFLGRPDAAADAELMVMIDELRRELGVELTFEINSLGDARCRPFFRQRLLEWGRAHLAELCHDCHQRLERNPLRLLDCKIDVQLTETAPKSADFLCDPCRAHFDSVRELLTDAGVPYKINPRLVRGLDYYSRTAFEVISTGVGAQSAVAAGGRYDGLVETLGGASVAGTGFAIGIDRLALALDAAKFERRPDAALIALGDSAMRVVMRLSREMRAAGLWIELLSPERGLKALLRRAGKIDACYAVIIGEDEISRDVVQLRDLRLSMQREVPRAEVVKLILAETGRATAMEGARSLGQ
jgi:histidyl-tRNA synthetase